MRSMSRFTLLALALSFSTAGSVHAQSGTKPASPPAAQSSATKPPAEGSGTEADARAIIHPNAQATKPLPVGDSLPALPALRNASGETVNLAEATRGKTTVLVFYRGGWCPYCNVHLADVARIQPELTANGIQLMAVSPDSVESLKKHAVERPLPYTLLSDSNHQAAKAFGIAFAVDEPTQAALKGYGIDLVAASGNQKQVLPVPAVFVIGPDGTIKFSHAEADYRKRLSGEEVLAAAGVKHDAAGSGAKTSPAGSAPKAPEAGSAAKENAPAPGSGSK